MDRGSNQCWHVSHQYEIRMTQPFKLSVKQPALPGSRLFHAIQDVNMCNRSFIADKFTQNANVL